MSLDSSFGALYIGPDKMGLLKAQKTKNGVNLLDKGYLNYGGYDNSGFCKDASNVLSTLLDKVELAKDSQLVVGIPQEFCLHALERAQLRLPQAEEYSYRHDKELLSQANNSPKDYACIEKSFLCYYEANGIQVSSPYGLITKEISADIALTYARQDILQTIESQVQKVNVKVAYIGAANALARRFIPYSTQCSDSILLFIGYGETITARAQNSGIKHSVHFTLGIADIIADLIKVQNIGYLHALALFEVLDLSITAGKNDKYTITVKGDKFEYNARSINQIALARIKQIFNCCHEALLKLGNPDLNVYLVCRGFSQAKGLVEIANDILEKDIKFASGDTLFFKDRPEEEALLQYCSSIAPCPKTNKKWNKKLISLFRRKKVG